MRYQNNIMLRTSFLLLSLFVVLTSTWAQQAATPSIEIIEQAGTGVLRIQADGQGKNRQLAEDDVRQRVLERLLYDGIAHPQITAVRLPMIPDRSKLTEVQLEALKDVLKPENTKRYYTEVLWVEQRPTRTSEGTKLQLFNVTINYDLFRRELENRGILRKFGYR